MGCGCCQQKLERSSYENIKSLAVKFSKEIGKIVIIYQQQPGIFSFIEYDTPEAAGRIPIEYISPLQ
jgi:hypothetical protein